MAINNLYARQYGNLAPTGGGAGASAGVQAGFSATAGGNADVTTSGIFILVLLALALVGYHGLKG
jgi:hypothetical protein